MKYRRLTTLLIASFLLPGNGVGQGPDSVFEEYDLDGDEVIDRIEFGMSAVAQKARDEGREEVIGERFNLLDTDKNNAVSREEFHRVLPKDESEIIFAESDRNNDGKLNQLEYFQASGASEMLRESGINFRSADGDKDGFVDRREWARVASDADRVDGDNENIKGFIRDRFDEADRDQNGQLSEAEFARSEFGKRLSHRGGRDIVDVFFARLNADGNDGLSLEEFSEGVGPKGRGGRKGKKGGGKKGGR